jgi:MFS family permease
MSILRKYFTFLKESSNRKRKFIKTCSFGSLIGTTIEFLISISMPTPPFWFFPNCFPSADSTNWFYLLGHVFDSISFSALGSAVFGHYGDKVGRKTTLVIALLTMGISTVSIGFT